MSDDVMPYTTEMLRKMCDNVRAAEREACAKIAETLECGPIYYVDGRPNAGTVIGGKHIAEAIRART